MRTYNLHSAFPLALMGIVLSASFSAASQLPGSPPVIPSADALPAMAGATAITPEEYAQRRADLAASLGDGVLVVFGSAPPELEFHPFGQNSPFLYLTGITEPDANLLISKANGVVESTIFVQPRNPADEIWDGKRLGEEGAEHLTGMRSESAENFLPMLEALATRLGTVYSVEADATHLTSTGLLERHSNLRVLPVPALDEIRGVKSATEMDLLERSGRITALAQNNAMRTIEPGMNEFEILALIEYTFRRHGGDRPSFPTIVGSGPNTTTLHYRGAERWMEDGELVLMDIGASYRGYAADVTRTVPINGRFSPDQRAVYSIVLDAQKAAEAAIHDGASWADINIAANRVLEAGLTRLGLIDGPGATYYCENPRQGDRCAQLRLFYMHALGHGVGLDVHDPDVTPTSGVQVGSAFTLEPGIYVRADALDYLLDSTENRAMIARLQPALERYANIGVRIEDMYLFTERGLVRPAETSPREIDEIERLMAEPGPGNDGRRPEVLDWYRATTGAR